MPLDVLHGAAGLRLHDVPEGRAATSCCAVRDGEVAAGVVAVHEYGDVVDLAGAVGAVGRQHELAVGRDVECYLDSI